MTTQQLSDAIRDRLANRLQAVATDFTADLRKTISVPVPPSRPRATPGAPPRRDTGNLQSQVSNGVDRYNLVARIYSPVFYGAILENKNHPWFWLTWRKNLGKYLAMLKG